MTIQVALTFPDFAAAQAFFNGAAMQPKAEAVTLIDDTKPAAAIDPLFASAPPIVETKPAKPGRKPKASEPAPAPAATVAPLDVKNGDPLPTSMQAPAASTVDPLEVPAFLDRREPAAEATPAKVWTEEEVRNVLKDVSAKHGLDAVRNLLVENCGKSRISEVPATDYAKLVDAAQKKIAS